MSDFLKSITITSVLAIMLIAGSFFLLGYLAVKYGGDATTRTQIITGLLTSIAAVTGYYFGASKKSATTVENVENVNNTTI